MENRTHLFLALLSIVILVDMSNCIKVSFNSQPTDDGINDTAAPTEAPNRPRRLIAPSNYQYFLFNGIHRYPQVPLLPQEQGPPRLPLLLSLAPVVPTPPPPPAPPKAKKVKSNKGAPGRPGVDYPTYRTIPPTAFDCRTQRYKGFFADPETQCQVWHYCDLNGGQASFLCPNGTIFNQVLLTCDWWFNVKCNSSLQAYVLNERLYKFITPHKPSFPEDFSGPQVDEYLVEKQEELRAKEQAKFERLKKKHKHNEFEDVDELQALLDKMRGIIKQ
ncbi:uncharacterized protein LOC132196445 [Neocloeon triangulifer]|uniref:uncharacterized protein LOC132196445 n=1 Tax=Neocloeon triangulifer TaxID=2078957 RepID=UPI00286F54D1|nr:uncharacterized protein LOC132196445 [Neocloeon triangulifer]